MNSQSQLPKTSTIVIETIVAYRLGLVWLESRLELVRLESRIGSGSFFISKNESLGSAIITEILGTALKSSPTFTSLVAFET